MEKILKKTLNIFILIAGSVVYAAGISLFLDPNNLAPGGVTGISIILNRFTSINVGTWAFIINVPILCIGWWKLGKRVMFYTVIAVGFSSAFMNIFKGYNSVTDDRLLAAVAGAVCVAVGIGLVFKVNGTTGGMDIIIRCVRLKYSHLKAGTLFLITDILVITASAIVFKDFEVAMYAGISSVLSSMVLDFVLYGRDEAKLLFIISEKEEVITTRLLQEADIGVTKINGLGAYTNKNRYILMCVMRKQRMPKVSNLIAEMDSKAFIIVSSASEIYGLGYKKL